MEGTLEEVRERAIPFHEGDEVLVSIVEPHMYAVDDAVAKIDGYIVSVRGGGPHVGEKRLVRIEEAGRTSATAVLVDQGAGSANGETSAARGRSGPGTSARTRKPPAKALPAAKPASTGPSEEAKEAKPTRTRRSRAKAPEPEPQEAGDAPAGDAAPSENGAPGEDGVESTPRRRGRRGGRRRSAAKAESSSSD
jgi:ribonuclease G